MSIKVTGASDDLIEIDGHIVEEFNVVRDEKGALAFSDGTLLRVRLDDDGIWRITALIEGPAFEGVDSVPADESRGYSDTASLGDGISWVAHCDEWTVGKAQQ